MSCEKYESGAGQAKQQQKARAHAVEVNLSWLLRMPANKNGEKVLPQNFDNRRRRASAVN